MKSASVKFVFRLLTLLAVFVVIVFSVTSLLTSSVLPSSRLYPGIGTTFTSERGVTTLSKISGDNTDRRREDSETPQKLALESDHTLWSNSTEDSKSSADDRAVLEMESYRYLHHPESLDRTYDVWDTQQMRNKVLRETCRDGLQEYNHETASPPSHLLVDDRNKFIFCEVRKVSSIAWRRVLNAVASANSTGGRTSGLRRLGTYSSRQSERRLRSYTKFMFVRDPMSRLVSGWRDKFVVGPQRRDYQNSWGSRIGRFSDLKTVNHSSVVSQGQGGHQETSSSVQGRNISFVEFVRYLTTGPLPSPVLRDMHWEPYHSRCRPCSVRYDFVGHYETLGPDAAAILGVIAPPHGGGRTVAFPVGRSDSITVARQEFPKLAAGDISRLAKLYDVDYKLFGYSMDCFMVWLQSDKIIEKTQISSKRVP